MYTPIDTNAPEDSDDENTPVSRFPAHVGSPSRSPRLPPRTMMNIGEIMLNNMEQSDDEAYNIAGAVGNQCSLFCQAYSMFSLVKEHYTKNAKNPLIQPNIEPAEDDDFEDMEIKAEYVAYIIFHEIRTTIQDCHTIAEAWKKKNYNDSTLEASVATMLMLCQPKMTKAAKTFGAYYQLLSSKTQNALEIRYAMNIGFILSLAGFKVAQPIVEEAPDNSRAGRLAAFGIDDDDVPEHFLCPVSRQIMEQPVSMGNDDVWHTYDASTVIRLANDEKEDARCPETRALFSTLKFKPNAALDKEIEEWLDSNARPERTNSPSI